MSKSSKLKKKQKSNLNFSTVCVALIMLFILAYYIGGRITGLTVYQSIQSIQNTKNWNFSNIEEYQFNSSLISLSNGARLLPYILITYVEDYALNNYSVVEATYDSEDKTSQITSIGKGIVTINKSRQLDIKFDNNLKDGDIIVIYFRQSDISDIYLCGYNASCDSPGYGLVSYDGEEGWYNLTITALNTTTDSISIDPGKVKIDYIYAYTIVNNSHTIENLTYPDSSAIDTNDLIVENLDSWGILSVDEDLNSQGINYYYSADSGESWNLIPNSSHFNLSSANSSKIRIRAELVSDKQNTPVLYSIKLNYTTKLICRENWAVQYSQCMINNAKTRYYNDSNNCFSTTGLQSDNYTGDYSEFSISCAYDNEPPAISGLIFPNNALLGELLNFSLSINDTSNISAAYIVVADSNYRLLKTLKLQGNGGVYSVSWNTSDAAEGTYIIGVNATDSNGNSAYYKNKATLPLFISDDFSFINDIIFIKENVTIVINLTNSTDAVIELQSNSSLTVAVSLVQYSKNVFNAVLPKDPLGKYIDITANYSMNDKFSKSKIKIYYNQSEIINAGLDESSLRIFYYNDTSNNWEGLNSAPNTTESYVWAEIPHFSSYGVFGDKKKTQEMQQPLQTPPKKQESNGDSGPPQKLHQKTAKPEFKEPQTEPAINDKNPCDYSITINIPEKISLVEANYFEGFVINDGNCSIELVNLSLSENLINLTIVENPVLRNINAGDSKEIYLRNNKLANRLSKARLAGLAVKPVKKEVRSYTGGLIGTGINGGIVVVQKDKRFDVEVLTQSKEIILNPFVVLGLMIFGAMVYVLKGRKKINK